MSNAREIGLWGESQQCETRTGLTRFVIPNAIQSHPVLPLGGRMPRAPEAGGGRTPTQHAESQQREIKSRGAAGREKVRTSCLS